MTFSSNARPAQLRKITSAIVSGKSSRRRPSCDRYSSMCRLIALDTLFRDAMSSVDTVLHHYDLLVSAAFLWWMCLVQIAETHR